MHFFDFCFVFEYYTMQIWRFLYFSMLQTLFSEKPLSGQKKAAAWAMSSDNEGGMRAAYRTKKAAAHAE